jgi:hypothetical protein
MDNHCYLDLTKSTFDKSFVKNFGTHPPSLPLSGKATHCKIEQVLTFVCAHVFWFVFGCRFFGLTKKTKHTHTNEGCVRK